MFLNCCLRLSELVEIDITDIKLDDKTLKIKGKSNKERMGYLNNDTYNALIKYLEIRKNIIPKNKKDEDKLFLSNNRTKICVATIRNLIKKAYNVNKI